MIDIAFAREKIRLVDLVFLNETCFNLPFKNNIFRRLSAVLPEIMPAFKDACAGFHLVDIEVFHKRGQNRRSEGMTFFTEGKEINIFFCLWRLDYIEFFIRFFNLDSPNVSWKVAVQVMKKLCFFQRFLQEQFKYSMIGGDHGIGSAGTERFEIIMPQDKW